MKTANNSQRWIDDINPTQPYFERPAVNRRVEFKLFKP